jgi:hypothetical protein
VPGKVVMPGQCVEVPDKLAVRTYLQQMFGNIGAVAIDRLPKGYKPVAVETGERMAPARRGRRPELVKVEELVKLVGPADGSEG